ncbi:MAG TPA: virulence factor [Caulobacteraceae bacterium]|jgi:virulence-associated protein VapD|nr:virulence factor [Caulobacteraceae bacterium]
MFAISFDLAYAETQAQHPAGLRQAYRDIERTLGRYGFARVQQSVYVSESSEIATLFNAMNALRAMPWFGACVKDIKAFRVENWSDFTPSMKGDNL